MADKRKAVALAGVDGFEMGSAGADYFPPESAATQRDILLNHLQQFGSISTVEARLRYFIMHPAGRIRELRHRGYDIRTERHPRWRFAIYHLMESVDQGGDHA